jgi:probable F420-dependent oxidoreductase
MRDELQALAGLRGTVGLWSFAQEAVPPGAAGEVARLVESLGFTSMWIPESFGRESLTSASLLLAGSSSLVVGTSIASIWARDAMAAANGSRTLSAASDGRFVLGLGVSHKPMVEDARGHDYSRPLSAMRSYLEALASAVMLSPEGSLQPPRMVAALGPAMLELAAELADGALPYLVTPEHTATARSILGPTKLLVVEQAVALTDDEDEFRRRAADHLGIYTSLPNYQNSWRRLGFDESDFVAGGSARLQDAMVVRGDEAAVLARIAEHEEAGADQVALQVLGERRTAAPEDDWRRLSIAIGER